MMCADIDSDLAEEHEALTQFVYLAPAGLVQARSDGEIVMINPVAAQLMMPLSHDGDLSNLFTALEDIAPDLRSRLTAFTAPQGMVCDGVHLLVPGSAKGGRRLFSFSLIKLDDSRFMAMLQDVTAQAQREHLLRHQEMWLTAILTGVSDYALIDLDANGCVTAWNESIGRVTGHGAEVVGRSLAVFYPEDAITPERVLDRLHEAEQSGWSLDDGWRMRADGQRFWGSAMIAPQRAVDATNPLAAAFASTDQNGYCLIIRDMSGHRDAAADARHAAVCDHLTGIGNRRAFFDAAETELRRWRREPRPLTLMLIDADHFKKINDTHGHPVGDAVLRHIARLMGATFRQVDVVARVGGEEFAVLLPSADLASAQRVAERLRAALEAQPTPTDGGPVACTVSIGIATMDEDTPSVEALLKRADEALYAAKHSGRNRVCGPAMVPAEAG
jgi:diguanylate cyclase (GGDEF)-like protein/PAS domain S-box-containing protein